MKLKFQMVDKSKKGFARYCPTFARAYGILYEKLEVRVAVFKIKHSDYLTSLSTLKTLMDAASSEVAKKSVVNLLIEILQSDDRDMQRHAAALSNTAFRRKDMSRVADALIEVLRNDNRHVREAAFRALDTFANWGNPETKKGLVVRVFRLLQSDWFLAEAEDNSAIYIQIASGCGKIMKILQEQEESTVIANEA